MTVIKRGQPGFIEPGTPEWAQIITPSKVAAILGISRWESPFSLWHRMKGLVPPEEPKDAFDLGHDLEPFAANRWRRKNPGWQVSAVEVQFHVPANHFPFRAVGTIDRRATRGRWRRNLEFKLARNLGDLELFGDDLTGECPDDYAAQCVAQRLFAAAAQPSAHWLPTSHLLVVGPYYNERIYEVEYDLEVASWMINELTTFWKSLDRTIPPDLDDQPATYECLKALHPDIDKGESVNVDPALALDYLEAKEDEKFTKSAALAATIRIADAMKTAQYAKVGDVTVADRRNNGRGGVSVYAGRSASPDKIREIVALR